MNEEGLSFLEAFYYNSASFLSTLHMGVYPLEGNLFDLLFFLTIQILKKG